MLCCNLTVAFTAVVLGLLL